MESSKAVNLDVYSSLSFQVVSPKPKPGSDQYNAFLAEKLGISVGFPDSFAESIPFTLNDVNAGAENEYQTAVIGSAAYVDLPLTIRDSNYYKNIIKRTERGDTSPKIVDSLRRIIDDDQQRIWEHSWVRFPFAALAPYTRHIFESDLRADKRRAKSPQRSDARKFVVTENGEELLRIPVSYLLKLALADACSNGMEQSFYIKRAAELAMQSYANDNTSPEIISFRPVPVSDKNGLGRCLARETALRFLLTQLLTMYANNRFQLSAMGQKVIMYSAPHPPVRQKELNDIISDSFYRELFINPCLSGWDKGEEKLEYMKLCHSVLSRSQLNAVIKLKEAGIITSNLTVIPNVSNICLANNSTHISLGSKKLTGALGNADSGFTKVDEKYCGDLAIKIIEHFLPLFVGTYSAAPYRLDFWDFHPEKALGFLPHELDFTHLRMIWRRWKKKAYLKVFGQPVTPFGPRWLDEIFSTVFRLRGDYVSDFRLLDYFASFMSTNESPALDGSLGNGERLREDLAELGIIDKHLSLYFLYRQRSFEAKGFSGFEGRYYSLFERFGDDMGEAVNLQTLLSALAFKYILKGDVLHHQIPDTPTVESERRQIFFCTAIGIPTFFIDADTPNFFMRKILAKTRRTRLSRRYSNYVRVYNLEYRRALIEILREDAADLIELYGMRETINNLGRRVNDPENCSAFERLTVHICKEAGISSPMKLDGKEFNLASEEFYRETLRKLHLEEAMSYAEEEIAVCMEKADKGNNDCCREALQFILAGMNPATFFESVRKHITEEKATAEVLSKLIQILLIVIEQFGKK